MVRPDDPISRRDFSKSLLATLGVGSLALLFGGGGGVSSVPTLETDPLAVLKRDGQQTIKPTATGFGGDILDLIDPSGPQGFSFKSDLTGGIQTRFSLLKLSTDLAPIALFTIVETDTFFERALVTLDPGNTLGFGTNAIILGDNGTIGGTATPVIVLLAGTGGWNPSNVLMVNAINPGGSQIGVVTIGVGNGVARPDHAHSILTSGLGTPAQVALVGARGASNLLPRFDHAHKGVVSISDGRQTAQTAAIASLLAFTVGASDGLFRIQGNVNITAFVAGTFNMTVTYTDETNTSRTLTLNFSSLAGTLGIALAAAGPFEGIPSVIRVKASTAITVATSGTFTSLTYNAEAMLEQLA